MGFFYLPLLFFVLKVNENLDVNFHIFRFLFQAISINKAINNHESPVKEKHVRSTIIGTFQEKGALTFWLVVSKLPLQDNRIVAWKFCHVLHKVLREGHPQVVVHSQRHRGMIEDLGKLWVSMMRRGDFLSEERGF